MAGLFQPSQLASTSTNFRKDGSTTPAFPRVDGHVLPSQTAWMQTSQVSSNGGGMRSVSPAPPAPVRRWISPERQHQPITARVVQYAPPFVPNAVQPVEGCGTACRASFAVSPGIVNRHDFLRPI